MSTSRPITNEEHRLIIKTMSETHIGIRPNQAVIHILTIECSTGLRLSDILSMKLSDLYLSDHGYRLKIREQKTKKERNVPIPLELQNYITEYAISIGIKRDEKIFNLTPRAVTKYIKKVTDYLGLENVSSHSWRKLYALTVYKKTGNDIISVQQALLHSSVAVTQRYLNRRSEKLEQVLQTHCNIVNLGENND